MAGEVKQGEIVDLDELVGLLSYVIEGAALDPGRPIPWGGISKLVKDINNRTSQIRKSYAVRPSPVPLETRRSEPLKSESTTKAADVPTASQQNSDAYVEEGETEVDTGLQSSSLARRIQMAPRPPAGRVREVPLNEPR